MRARVAYLYRAGRWREAVDALRESMSHQEDPCHGFFLAMALHRLGETPEARVGYDRAVAWTRGRAPGDEANDEQLLRFKEEAVALLGVVERRP